VGGAEHDEGLQTAANPFLFSAMLYRALKKGIDKCFMKFHSEIELKFG
jgi:hypothetical protein